MRNAWIGIVGTVAIVVMGCLSSTGCGGDDNTTSSATGCKAGTTECISNQLARTCPPDGSRWVSYACASGETCQNNACTSSAPCTPGKRECIAQDLSRVCPADGSSWIALPCNVGESCDPATGACVIGGADGGGTLCSPGTTACATDKIVKVCESDGSGYVPMACNTDEKCVSGKCVVDTSAGVCQPYDAKCQDASTSLVCQASGAGYTVTTCPSSTTCEQGLCTGTVCRIGESKCDSSLVRLKSCVNGTEWQYTFCASGQICAEDTRAGYSQARCTTLVCTPGDAVCGDPTDPTVDPTTNYTRCEKLIDGSYDWVRYQCAAPETCDPNLVSGTRGCSATCTPGAQRCTSTLLGYQQCTDAGEWGPVVDCNTTPSDTMLQCEPKPSLLPGQLAQVVCADPVCRYIQYSLSRDSGGTCQGAQIRLCDQNGRLATTATSCDTGICANLSTVAYGGYLPGACRVDCQVGDERCVSNGTTLYQTCVDGVWSSTAQTCPNNAACWSYTDIDGTRVKLCGAECTPGSRQCSGTLIQYCDSAGHWGSPTACALGTCKASGGSFACIADCIPGAITCTGTTVTASDGVSKGTSSQQVCTTEGTLPPTPTPCAGTTTCRTTSTGLVLGCVECVGSAAPGGNSVGLPDSRCASVNGLNDAVQTCGASNDWDPAVACTTGTCRVPQQSYVCATGCVTTTLACSDSAITAYYGSSTYNCAYFGYGSPAPCGSTPDCCGTKCTTSTAAPVSSAYCGG